MEKNHYPVRKQPNSRYCFLCGISNPIGLGIRFYEEGTDRVIARYRPREEHQGYPGVLHGGIASALLDETIGRTLVPHDLWAMTVELAVRFHKPIPVGEAVTVVGELVRLRSRTMEGRGEIRLSDGSLAASAEAKYILLNEEQTERFRQELEYWEVVPDAEDPNRNDPPGSTQAPP